MRAGQTMPKQRIWNGKQTVHLIQEDDGFILTRVSLEDVPLVMSKFRVEIRGLEKTFRKKWPCVRSVSIEKQLQVMKNPHVPGAAPISPGHLVLVVAYLYLQSRSRRSRFTVSLESLADDLLYGCHFRNRLVWRTRSRAAFGRACHYSCEYTG